MKKFIAVLITLLLCVSLFAGCNKANEWTDSGFTYIERKGNVHYLYHNDTKVIYVFYEEYSGYSGGMTALLNTDGTPMLCED
jgi:hypothetical protein